MSTRKSRRDAEIHELFPPFHDTIKEWSKKTGNHEAKDGSAINSNCYYFLQIIINSFLALTTFIAFDGN